MGISYLLLYGESVAFLCWNSLIGQDAAQKTACHEFWQTVWGISGDRSCLIEPVHDGFLPSPGLAHSGHNIAGNHAPVYFHIVGKLDR